MKIKTFKIEFIQTLTPVYESAEIESMFIIALEHIEKKSRYDLMLDPDLDVTDLPTWKKVLDQLVACKPIQYIFNTAHFYGLVFNLNDSVLVPRPETEELVQWVIDSAQNLNKPISILDIGTGSGCIAISLAKALPNATVHAMDVSEQALQTARENARLNQAQVNFIQQDVLALEALSDSYDIIVSNPPYVRELEKQQMHENVLNYEPHLALFVSDQDPLLFYRKITSLAQKSLKPNGMLFFEINQYLGSQTLELLDPNVFKDMELRKDFMENDRMIAAVKREL